MVAPGVPEPVGRDRVRVAVGSLLDGYSVHLRRVEEPAVLFGGLAASDVTGKGCWAIVVVEGTRGGANIPSVGGDEGAGRGRADRVIDSLPEFRVVALKQERPRIPTVSSMQGQSDRVAPGSRTCHRTRTGAQGRTR